VSVPKYSPATLTQDRMQLAAKLSGNDEGAMATLQKLVAGIDHL
jgi:hypothetical protein